MSVFEIKPNDGFYLDGKPFQVISGTIHYFRVVPEYWRDRLLKLRALGCNTVETYIAWNWHEPRKGEFDFTGMHDVEEFIRIAQELGLYVIIRPSPYICAEWEFGGFPAWLLKDSDIRLRCYDEKYLRHVMDYFDELIPRLVPLQITHGGPIIMMQVENEYGSYGDDKEYLAALRDAMIERGVDVPLVTSDGPEHDMLMCGQCEGVFQTGNFGSRAPEQFKVLENYGIAPQMCMEFWCGWFDAWGFDHQTTKPEDAAQVFADLVRLGHVNIYVFHGGTHFGLMNGANDYDYLSPDVTSYDYDAPLSEHGGYTEKYRLFREVLEKHYGHPIEHELPAEMPRKAYGEAKLVGSAALPQAVESIAPVHSVTPVSMERIDQGYGYILYRTTMIHENEIRKLQLVDAADRAKVYLDGELILTLYDRELEKAYEFETPVPVRKGARLDILVENIGRVNYSYKMIKQRKGIDSAVVINNHQHYGWDIYRIDEPAMLSMPVGESCPAGQPGVYDLTFDVDTPADTWLELPGWGKGVVLLNGFCLGRFWEIGPQKRLYIPAPLLKAGVNELRIIESEGKTGPALLADEPSLG